MNIIVYYDDETHEPTRIKIIQPTVIGDDRSATFGLEGSSAYLKNSDCSGETLSEAFDHVRELPFVQGVEEL